MSEYIHKSHNVSVLMYHFVCPAKYRRIVFSDEVDQTLKSICDDISKRYEIKFLEIGVDKNHVHFLIQSVPMYAPSRIVRIFKSITAKEIFKKCPEVKKQLSARVTAEINLLGISPKMIGRKYLIEAIMLVIEGQRKHVATIAKKYDKTEASVERAMQHSINHTWRNADIDDLQTFYTARINSDKGVPTLNEFVYYYAEKMST